MTELIERLVFWWKIRSLPFHYNLQTGEGLAVESYCVFLDFVKLRYSRFGYVRGTGWERRKRYLAMVHEYEAIQK